MGCYGLERDTQHHASVAKPVDATDLKSVSRIGSAGSIPAARTNARLVLGPPREFTELLGCIRQH